MSVVAKVAGGLVLAFGAATGIWWMASPRITEREAALRVVQGRVVNAHVEPGVKMDAVAPHIQYVILPKWVQETVVSATEKDQQTVRTKEDARIFGTYTISYEIDNSDPNFGNIYTKLKIDEEEDIKQNLNPKINALAVSAVIDIYKGIPTADINDDIPGIGKRITESLQKYMNEYGYSYIKIVSVMPSGVGLSPKANADLEAIVSEQRKMDLLNVQKQVAEKSVEVTKIQTEVTLEALDKYKAKGYSGQEAIQAYYLQLLQVTDKVGTPNVPGPIPGTGVGAVPNR